jgi:hypothetical protein
VIKKAPEDRLPPLPPDLWPAGAILRRVHGGKVHEIRILEDCVPPPIVREPGMDNHAWQRCRQIQRRVIVNARKFGWWRYEYEGVRYRTLCEVVTAIVGYHVNPMRFFRYKSFEWS